MFWEPGYPNLPACGPWRGSIDGLVRPSFGNNNSRPSREARPREVDDTKTTRGSGLPRWPPEERRFLCRYPASRGCDDVRHDACCRSKTGKQPQAGHHWTPPSPTRGAPPLVSSASRGLAPREGLELLMLKLGRTRPSMEPRGGPQAGRAKHTRIEDADNQDRGLTRMEVIARPTDMSCPEA